MMASLVGSESRKKVEGKVTSAAEISREEELAMVSCRRVPGYQIVRWR
jgi:hypothetical protein